MMWGLTWETMAKFTPKSSLTYSTGMSDAIDPSTNEDVSSSFCFGLISTGGYTMGTQHEAHDAAARGTSGVVMWLKINCWQEFACVLWDAVTQRVRPEFLYAWANVPEPTNCSIFPCANSFEYMKPV